MANREHKGHSFYIDNPHLVAPPAAPSLPPELVGRRCDLQDGARWQWWRWSIFHDPNSRRRTMLRLTLFRTPWLWAMLHWHFGPDQPRLHTHWSWLVSFVFRGSYVEERLDGERRVRWFNFVRRGAYHRIASVDDGARSIVFTGGLVDRVRYTDSPTLRTVR